MPTDELKKAKTEEFIEAIAREIKRREKNFPKLIKRFNEDNHSVCSRIEFCSFIYLKIKKLENCKTVLTNPDKSFSPSFLSDCIIQLESELTEKMIKNLFTPAEYEMKIFNEIIEHFKNL